MDYFKELNSVKGVYKIMDPEDQQYLEYLESLVKTYTGLRFRLLEFLRGLEEWQGLNDHWWNQVELKELIEALEKLPSEP